MASGHVGGRPVVVTGGTDDTVRIWDELSADPYLGHIGPVWSLAAGRTDRGVVVVSGSGDRTVRIWDAATGTRLGNPFTGHTGNVWAVVLERSTVVRLSSPAAATAPSGYGTW